MDAVASDAANWPPTPLTKHRICHKCRKEIANPDRRNSVWHKECRPKVENEYKYYQQRFQLGLPFKDYSERFSRIRQRVVVRSNGIHATVEDDVFMEIRTCASCHREFVARDPRAQVCSLWCYAPTPKYRRQAVGNVGI